MFNKIVKEFMAYGLNKEDAVREAAAMVKDVNEMLQDKEAVECLNKLNDLLK